MSLTRPIPIEAWPVVEVLRRDVPRPEPSAFVLGFLGRCTPCLRDRTGRCPMGMHPTVSKGVRTPTRHRHFESGGPLGDPAKESAIDAFFRFWDQQSDPEAAVAAVWDREQGWTGDEVPGCDSAEAITKEMK